MRQFEINFQPGLTEQFPDFRDCIKQSVYGCGRALKAVAADLEMTSSELSRKLGDNPNDPVNFPLHRLPELIEATGDKTPVHWLIEKYLESAQAKRDRVLAQVDSMLPELVGLVKSLRAADGKAD